MQQSHKKDYVTLSIKEGMGGCQVGEREVQAEGDLQNSSTIQNSFVIYIVYYRK